MVTAKHIIYLMENQFFEMEDILPRKQITFRFLYNEYRGSEKKKNNINEILDELIKIHKNSAQKNMEEIATDDTLKRELYYIEYLKRIKEILNFPQEEFNNHLETLRIRNIICKTIIRSDKTAYLSRCKDNEKYLINEAKTSKENKDKIIKAFDEVILSYKQCLDLEANNSDKDFNYVLDMNMLTILLRFKERVLALSTSKDDWTEENEKQKTEEIINKILNNNYNQKEIDLFYKFLEFQYIYNRDCFIDAINKLRDKNPMEINNFLLKMETISELTTHKKSFIEMRVGFLEKRQDKDEYYIYYRHRYLNNLFEEYQSNKESKDFIDDILKNKIEKYEIFLEEKEGGEEGWEKEKTKKNIEYLKHLQNVLNFSRQNFDNYLEELDIKHTILNLATCPNDEKDSKTNKLNEECFREGIKKDKNKVIKAPDELIAKRQRLIVIEEERNKNNSKTTCNDDNDNEEYAYHSNILKAIIELKNKLFP
jgi:hypothetical protein